MHFPLLRVETHLEPCVGNETRNALPPESFPVGSQLPVWHKPMKSSPSVLVTVSWNGVPGGGLAKLENIGGSLSIENIPKISTLYGLSTLTSIGENLIIQDNGALQHITDLSGVESIGGFITIQRNEFLFHIDNWGDI